MKVYEENISNLQTSAMALTFRAPLPGEFGHKYLKDSLLYVDQTLREPKPLSWFLGNDEYPSQSIWAEFAGPYKLLCNIGQAIKTGSHPIDDELLDFTIENFYSLGIDLKDSNFQISDKCGRGRLIQAFSLLSNPTIKDTFVIPKRNLVPADFLKELKEGMIIKDLDHFKKLVALSLSKDGENTSTDPVLMRHTIRDIHIAVLGNKPKMRSAADQLAAESDIWAHLSSTYATTGVPVFKVLDIPDELVVKTARLNGNMPRILDERAVIESSIQYSSIQELNAGDKIHIGRLDTSTNKIPHTMQVIPIQITESGLYKMIHGTMTMEIKFNHSHERFGITVCGPITNSTGKSGTTINVKAAQLFIEKLDAEYKEHSGIIPGTLVDLPITELDNVISSAHHCIPDSPILTPVFLTSTDRVTNWTDFVIADVKVKPVKQQQLITLLPYFDGSIESKSDIKKLYDQTCDALKLVNKEMPTKYGIEYLNERSEIITAISDGIDTIYKEIYPVLKLALRLTLNSDTIDRPYLINNKEEISLLTAHNDYHNLPKPGYVKTDVNSATTALTPAAISIAATLLTKHGTEEEALANRETPAAYTSVLLGSPFKKASGFALRKDKKLNKGKNKHNLSKLSVNVVALLTEVLIMSLIENEILLNFGSEQEDKVVRPSDFIQFVLTNTLVHRVKMNKSIFANI
jgi:hypothetical protein